MSHCSTTATSTYTLTKYSKSYPHQGKSQGRSQAVPEVNKLDWQHFTNPTIRLVLDIKQREKELESVRLRIIWSMNSGDLGYNSTKQSEVVFEDIDMLLLSYISQRGPPKRQQFQGFPIKAVYRDSVVGIRYLHGDDTMTEPVYRRFQITFMTSSAVLEFIDAIRSICPCKANPSTMLGCDTASNTRATLDLPTAGIRPPITAHPTSSQLLYRHAPLASVPQTQYSLAPVLPAQFSVMDSQAPPPSTRTLSTSRTEARLIRRSPINMERNIIQSPSALTPRRPNIDLFARMKAVRGVNSNGQGPAKQNSLSRSSSPNSSASNNISPNLDVILSSLRNCSALYDLPQSTLEKIVGDIVREEDFTRLVSICQTVWKKKHLIEPSDRWKMLPQCGKLEVTWVYEVDCGLTASIR